MLHPNSNAPHMRLPGFALARAKTRMQFVQLLVWMCFGLTGVTSARASVDYAKDIKPLLQDKCYACHGALKQKGGLRLDAGTLIHKGGEHSVLGNGDAGKSALLERVLSEDPEERMPPKGKRLSKEQTDLLRQWIQSGATFPPNETVPKAPSEHWAFQPLEQPPIPQLEESGGAVNPIDAFIFSSAEKGRRRVGPQASASGLLRRIHLDLTGLPPTPAEQDAFEQDQSPQRLEAVIEALLARPEYGERWARHWQDTVRYADSNGYERDKEKPFVWRYRDYLIQSLNQDKPYDRLILEQLAGDELPDASLESRIGAGFLRLGHWDDEPADRVADRFDQLDDIVSTTAQAFLGLSMGCARCHDHKFEPLSTKDYYSFLSIFNPLHRPSQDKPITFEGTELYNWEESSPRAPETFVLLRGSPSQRGERVEPAVPAIFGKTQPTFPLPDKSTTRRRLGLAHWIASPENPLTARVIVNRVWQQHFGRGLVTTANDFGLMGAPPSHPELLDWLAVWFSHDAQWSFKKLHHLILTSRAWQSAKTQDSVIRYRRLEVEAIRDGMLAVSGRLNPQRWGPAIKPPIPEAALEANTDRQKVWTVSPEPDASRRSIYAFIKRGLVLPMFETLDLADTVSSCPQRQVTTVAPQALTLFNGVFVNQQAKAFAERLQKEAGDSPEQQLRLAFKLALCRAPSQVELAQLLAFVDSEPLSEACRVILNLNEFVYPE